ncbi:ribosome small subunit-dependent GTPase A [candidate division WOR-3 bacterium]|nr:ribosome small subunit-dependent GTPase A [candidate division WOR-3 bacterium]
MHFWNYVLRTKYCELKDYCTKKDTEIGIVTSQEKDRYRVFNENSEIFAEISGKLEYFAASPEEYPAVGDIVSLKLTDGGSKGIILEIFPRRNFLARKGAGIKTLFCQIIAANVDRVFIVQGLDNNFNPRRIERYLSAIDGREIQKTVLLSKSDLLCEKELAESIRQITACAPDIRVLAYSALSAEGVEGVKSEISPGEVFCFIGSSGAGKSTLINTLLEKELLKVREVKEFDSKGRHTTSRRQMIFLSKKSALIDTPGMREFGLYDPETDIDAVFTEISELSELCRFSDCTHTVEPGCEVLKALESGLIDKKRYKSFVKLSKEKEYILKTKSAARKDKNEWEKKIALLTRRIDTKRL